MAKYNEIMEHIELTEERRERIIGNIAAAQRKRRFNTAVTWISAAAACLVISIGAVSVLGRPSIPKTPPESTSVTVQTTISKPAVTAPESEADQTQGIWVPNEYDSVEALSAEFGVELHDISDLPFTVKERRYLAFIGNFAEIDYDGANGENCCIRVGSGTEDVSGDYNEYDSVTETEINGVEVTFKGFGETVNLASWVKDGHFYSVSLSDGADKQTMNDIVRNIM